MARSCRSPALDPALHHLNRSSDHRAITIRDDEAPAKDFSLRPSVPQDIAVTTLPLDNDAAAELV